MVVSDFLPSENSGVPFSASFGSASQLAPKFFWS
jgi:hypothetical protein